MKLPFLKTPADFPPPSAALADPNGLLAIGGKLTPEWLLKAYSQGTFPWFNEGEPILWWSPSPRMVLFPSEFRLSRSLSKTIRHSGMQVRFNTAFSDVMHACAAPRKTEHGTWISPRIIQAYTQLHHLGFAHSIETWKDGELIGGLYGVTLGKIFFGESMFHRVNDASKVAMAYLVQHLEKQSCPLIDCQMKTGHLASLGAQEIPGSDFQAYLAKNCGQSPLLF